MVFKRFIFLLFFALNLSAFASEVQAPSGAMRNLSVKDFMPHPSISEEFNETWSYQFIFDNGTRAFINFSKLYIPASGNKVTCDLSFWNFNKQTYTVGRQYPPERLKHNEQQATIDFKGEYKMEGKPGKGHRVLFTANKNGKFFLDVVFENAETGRVLGDGIWKIGKEKYAQYIHIPFGRVKGRIGFNEDTLEVKGYAYMEQIWQSTQAIDLAARSINFSAPTRNSYLAGRINLTPKGIPFGYAILKNDTETKIVTAKNITDNKANYNGKKFPKEELAFEWNEQAEQTIFKINKPFQKASLLDKVDGWIAKKAFKFAAGGEVFFYRGRSTSNDGKKIDWVITGVKD